MRKMTVKERLEDISNKSGLSEDIIRRVLMAERDSILESLKRGERATLIGRCVVIPELRSKLNVGGQFRKVVKLSAFVLDSLESELVGVEEFEDTRENDIDTDGIRLLEISSLT